MKDAEVPYLRAKIRAERRAWELADELGLDLVTVLPGGIGGPGFARRTPMIADHLVVIELASVVVDDHLRPVVALDQRYPLELGHRPEVVPRWPPYLDVVSEDRPHADCGDATRPLGFEDNGQLAFTASLVLQ